MIGLMMAAAMAAGNGAEEPANGRPRALAPLVACRAIADEKQRVTCYDREVAALDAAERDRKVVVLDQEQVKTTRRSLFGFTLPALKLFGGGKPDGAKDAKVANDELVTLDTVVTTIARQGDGQVAFTVENGARWVQTDDRTVSLARIRAGTKVRITKGALGSYFAAFDKAISIKVRRVG